MRKLLVVVGAVALLAACGEKKEDGKAPVAEAKTAPTTPPPTPYAGPLTVDRIMATKGLVRPSEAWADAIGKLEGQVGKATRVDGKYFVWAVMEGETCAYCKVEKVDEEGGQVGAVYSPMKVTKDGPSMNWDECLEAAGAKKEAAEDPNAPAPPTDGKAVTIAELHDGVAKAKSRWVGAKVKLTGLYNSTSTATSGDVKSVTVTLSPAKGDIKSSVGCTLAAGAAEPAGAKQWDEMTVEGTVTDVFGGSLDACQILPAAKGKGKTR